MCECKNVECGTYKNTVIVNAPRIYNDKFPNIKEIQLDKCIAKEIEYLWNKGIITMASCCGHNRTDGFISVLEEYIPKMKELGYEVLFNPFYPNAEWSFKPKSYNNKKEV